jgi:GLPGLI family protein
MCIAKAQVLPKQDQALYKATFHISFQTDSTNPASLVQEEAVLLIGKNVTKFESANKIARDSMMSDKNTQQNIGTALSQIGKIPKTKFLFVIYQYNHQIIYRDQIVTERFQYVETPDFNWQLVNNDSVIAGYTCKMATCHYGGRNYTAWYTEEIPIPTGPYKFFGLPGFIVAVQDSLQQLQFVLTGFKKITDNTIITPGQQNYTQVSKSVFLETLKKYKSNPSMALNNTLASLKINLDESAKHTASEKLKKENNLIEKF